MLLVAAATHQELAAVLGDAAPARQGEVAELEADGRRVLALVTGVGMLNAALETGRVLAVRGDLAGVLDVGVAGSLDVATHPVGCVRVVESEIWPEYGLLAHGAVTADARALCFSLDGSAPDAPDAVFDTLAWDAGAELAAMGLGPATEKPRARRERRDGRRGQGRGAARTLRTLFGEYGGLRHGLCGQTGQAALRGAARGVQPDRRAAAKGLESARGARRAGCGGAGAPGLGPAGRQQPGCGWTG